MSEPMHGGFQKAMVGATADLKAQLRQQVDPVTYEDVLTAALRILEQVPDGIPVGTRAAALMLAATSFTESASQAAQLIHHGESDAES